MHVRRIAIFFVCAGALVLPSTASAWLLYQDASGFGTGRTVGSNPTMWTVRQPFDVTGAGWNVTTIGTNGWRITDPNNLGFIGTLYTDNGTGLDPNLSNPLGTQTFNFNSSNSNQHNWSDRTFNVTLTPGRYWMEWKSSDPSQWSAIYLASTGLPSYSTQNGTGRFAAGATTLRIEGSPVPEPATIAMFAAGLGFLARRRRK